MKKEKELEWLRGQTEYHPLVLWLREGETKFFLILMFLLVGAFGYLLYQKQMHIRSLYSRLSGSHDVLVTVGEEELRRGPFEQRLWERNAERELRLETLRLLLEQATSSIDPRSKEYRTLEDADREKRALSLVEEVDFLEEKLHLSKVGNTERHKLFETKKAELVVYDISALRFTDVQAAENFIDSFLRGMTPDRAAEEYSMDSRPVRLRAMMDGELEKQLGVYHARAVKELDPGKYSAPLPTQDGHFTVYRLNHRDTDFDQVLPAINSMLAHIGREETRRNLVENANIVSEQITPKQLIELKL